MAFVALCAALFVLPGCNGWGTAEDDVPLPEIDGGDAHRLPKGVYALIRMATLPLDESTDDAWAVTDEQAVPLLTRSAWRGNGMRIGVVGRDRFKAYTDAMPEPVSLGETLINRSAHPVPIIETPRLHSDLQFEVDLTRPPMPRHAEDIVGGKNSTLRLLARIETDSDGRHTLVLTPQHHIPSPYDLIPRSPLEKEMDGRVFDELTVRLQLKQDEVAVVGLHWPWPEQEVLGDPEKGDKYLLQQEKGQEKGTYPLLSIDADDPAAPPPHLAVPAPTGPVDNPSSDDGDVTDHPGDGDDGSPAPRVQRVAPPLPTSFGSTLFTATRIRQPVRQVLLITIVQPKAADPSDPAESNERIE